MAIIRSLGIGRGRKSAGNVTYRTVRGRTIASEKVGERPTSFEYSGAQLQRQAIFSFISRFIRIHSESIDVSFSPTRYGSARNRFTKVNYAPMSEVALGLAENPTEVDMLSDAEIDAAVGAYATANPTSIRRVDLRGEAIVYLAGPWSEEENPEPGGTPELFTVGAAGDSFQLVPVSVPNTTAFTSNTDGLPLEFTGRNLNGATLDFITPAGGVVDPANYEVLGRTATTISVLFGSTNAPFGSVRLSWSDGTQLYDLV